MSHCAGWREAPLRGYRTLGVRSSPLASSVGAAWQEGANVSGKSPRDLPCSLHPGQPGSSVIFLLWGLPSLSRLRW